MESTREEIKHPPPTKPTPADADHDAPVGPPTGPAAWRTAVFLGCVVASAIVGWIVLQINIDKNRAQTEQAATHFAKALENKLSRHTATLNALKGLFAASRSVERSEFKSFTAALFPDLPELETLAWIPRVTEQTRDRLERAARIEGLSDFRITGKTNPNSEQNIYRPIYFAEPAATGKTLLGQDLSGSMTLKHAMDRSGQTNEIAAVSAVPSAGQLPFSTAHPEASYLLMFAPVVKNTLAPQPGPITEPRKLGHLMGITNLSRILSSVQEQYRVPVEYGLFNRAGALITRSTFFENPIQTKLLASAMFNQTGWRKISLGGQNLSLAVVVNRQSGLAANFLPALIAFAAGIGLSFLARNRMIASQAHAHSIETANLRLRDEVTDRETQNERLKILFQAIEQCSAAVMVTDATGRIEYVNRKYRETTGYTLEEVLGKSPRLHQAGRTSDVAYEDMVEAILEGGEWQGEFLNKRKNGELYWAATQISPVRSKDGIVTNFVATADDITVRKKSEAQIRHLAHHDSLTGLPNRVLFNDRLQQAFRQAKRNKGKLAVISIDLDNFKDVNDTLGHDAGDFLLKKVAERLLSATRETDLVSASNTVLARIGGDEFNVILTGLENHDQAALVCTRIIDSLAVPFRIMETTIYSGATIGIAMHPDDGESPTAVLKNSDIALYSAKAEGRNNYKFYKPEMQHGILERKSLEADLRRALENGDGFALNYQPQIDLTKGRIVGAEALMRWTHPTRGSISPTEFIPIAESCGLILPLSNWVLHEACRHIKARQDAGQPPLTIAINLSPVQFKQGGLATNIEQVIDQYKISPATLAVEITETVVMLDTRETIATLKRLKEMGLRIALDDFGTGYSSLSYLTRFQVDKIKLDRTFIQNLDRETNRAVIEALVTLGHSLGMVVNAEGLETKEQVAKIIAYGVDEAQGFIFSRPVPIEELNPFITQSDPFDFARNYRPDSAKDPG